MEGKELLRLLDFAEDLRKKGDKFEEGVKEAIDESRIAYLKTTARAYKEIAGKLESLIRELNS